MSRGRVIAAVVAAALLLALPAIDLALASKWRMAGPVTTILAFTVIGLGLNIVTGFTGQLHLGAAAFVAIGAYAYAILTCPIYPFEIGFWGGLAAATVISAVAGALLALPTMRLRGDYLAIVTLGLSEIVQDLLKNKDLITKGTQGINPVASPPTVAAPPGATPSWADALIQAGGGGTYWLYLGLLVLAALLCRNLRRSRVGRGWVAVREDELAARSSGVEAGRAKLAAFAWGSALCGAGGAMNAALVGTSIEPAFYDFQLSFIVLCAVIVGGMGSIPGVLLGSALMFGLNTLVLTHLGELIGSGGDSQNVLAQPNNWKFMAFGLALILVMRFKPEGLLPAREVRAELRRPAPAPSPSGSGAA